MKSIFTFLFFSLSVYFSFGQDSRQCTDLIISEIVFSDDGNNDHAVEIFNPTGIPINLTNYRIELLPESGSGVSIPLTGTLASGDVAVVTTRNATSTIDAIADIKDDSLNFDNKSVLQLVRGIGGTLVDRVGNQGVSTDLSSIDLDALVNDPDYLDGLNINLGSLKNLVVRRKRKVRSGSQVFDNEDIFDNWAIYLNLDLEDLGDHKNACMVPVLSWKDWKMLEPEDEREEGDLNPVFGTIESTEILTEPVFVFFELDPHEFIMPPADEAFEFFDFSTPLNNPTITYELAAGSSEFEFEIMTVVPDGEQEGDEGTGFRFDITLGSPAMVDFDEDLFDVLIREMNTNTHSVELAEFLKIYPSIVNTSATVEVSGGNLEIQEISIFGMSGQSFRTFEYPNVKKAIIDFSGIEGRGLFSVVVKTSEGITSKKVLKP